MWSSLISKPVNQDNACTMQGSSKSRRNPSLFWGAALVGGGAAAVVTEGAGEANTAGVVVVGAKEGGRGTLISTFWPAWQWPGTPHMKKWWPRVSMVMESLPVVWVEMGMEALHALYSACVTRITLWNWGLYSKTVTHSLSLSLLLLWNHGFNYH